MKAIGMDYAKLIKAGYGVFVARIEIDYKKPATIDDELIIKTWPLKKGAVSGVIAQNIMRGEDLVAAAKVTWAFVDSRGVPVKVPKEFDSRALYPA
jgi:acyl-CoA thioester hydrolase